MKKIKLSKRTLFIFKENRQEAIMDPTVDPTFTSVVITKTGLLSILNRQANLFDQI